MNKKQLIEVFEDTKLKLDSYPTESETKIYDYTELVTPPLTDKIKEGTIDVVSTDTITTVINLTKEFPNKRICMLNMASEKKPGGGVINGAKSQEECLFRCTDLYKTVVTDYYPLTIEQSLYTTDSIIIKDVEYNDIAPIYVDCITIPAINLNKYNYEDNLYDVINERKIRLMLSLPKIHDCDIVVLGSWGCGVFGNEPEYISNKFKEVLDTFRMRYHFDKVVFGIINDYNSVDNNYEIFYNNLNDI